MSLSDRPGLMVWQKMGCVFYVAAAFFFCMGAFVYAYPSYPPYPPEHLKLLLFPGSILASIGGGVLLVRYFKRDLE